MPGAIQETISRLSHLSKTLDKVVTGVPAQLAYMFPLTVELLQDKNNPELVLCPCVKSLQAPTVAVVVCVNVWQLLSL